jgi:hypothetical protein
VEVILVAVIVSVIAPTVLGLLTNHQRRIEKREDWARQDQVAAEARRQQDEVAAQAQEAASLLLAQNAKVAASTEATQQKLDVIHILVNSNMTAAMQAELDATRRDLVSLREVARLNEEAGRPLSTEARTAINETAARIAKLDADLSDRLKQTQIADKEGRA